MKILELFSGTESFSKVARERGHECFTIDLDRSFNPSLCKDILEVTKEDIPFVPDVIWASPPCTTFSVASIRHYWEDGRPKNLKTLRGLAIIEKTLWIIDEMKPKFWIMENPRGMLRKQDVVKGLKRDTVTYCQYGSHVQKPTDLWNNLNHKFRPMCKPKADCHDHQPRTYSSKKKAGVLKLGTQGRKSNYEKVRNPIFRAIVPEELCLEIIKVCEKLI